MDMILSSILHPAPGAMAPLHLQVILGLLLPNGTFKMHADHSQCDRAILVTEVG